MENKSFSADDIKRQLIANFSDEEINVSPNPFDGFEISIVSNKFHEMTNADRRKMVLDLIPSDSVAILELLSPEEAEAESSESASGDLGLPLWPEALARSAASDLIEVNLPSLDQQLLSPPLVATFYSLRGGVGRTTALAHTAYSLAKQGLKVLCIDMDLEAPGLSTMLGTQQNESIDKGVVHLLNQADIYRALDPEKLTDSILRVDSVLDLSLLPAGTPSANYARELELLDPSAWYREDSNPLRILVDSIRELPSGTRPDVILIDSRTGMSPIAAPLLFDVADIAVMTFYPHQQAYEGTKLLSRALLGAKSQRVDAENRPFTPEPRFLVSPLPASPEPFATMQERAQNWIEEWVRPARDRNGSSPFAVEEITHAVSYSESTATADSVHSETPTSPYDEVAAWIAGIVDTDSETQSISENDLSGSPSKMQILDSLSFEGQTADSLPYEQLKHNFINTTSVNEALDTKRSLVIGRKGTGKTLIFRYLHESKSQRTAVVTGPSGDGLPLDADVFTTIGAQLDASADAWRPVWLALLVLVILRNDPEASAPKSMVLNASGQGKYTRVNLNEDVHSLITMDNSALEIKTWLTEYDRALPTTLMFLFDGLDTGFDSNEDLRTKVVTSLLTLVNTTGRDFKNLIFKVFVREDIYQATKFPNKSHLRADAAVLVWNNQMDFLRLVVHRALQSGLFKEFAQKRLEQEAVGRAVFSVDTAIEYWPDEQLLMAWRLLVGERMAGGKTAYTDKWVWSRLADANGDHAPRYLIRLFQSAVRQEIQAEPKNPYTRTLIRPKSLIDALDNVSQDAREAIEEEFPELQTLIELLERVATTPFDFSLLESIANKHQVHSDGLRFKLAREVGLVESIQSFEDRYRVPELYRTALKMTRKGQR